MKSAAKIAAALMRGPKSSASPEPDGDEQQGGIDIRAQLVHELSAIDPQQLVEIVATVLSEYPDVLRIFQEEMGEPSRTGGDGAEQPMPAEEMA